MATVVVYKGREGIWMSTIAEDQVAPEASTSRSATTDTTVGIGVVGDGEESW